MLDVKCTNNKCPMCSPINDSGCIAKFEVWANCDMTGFKVEPPGRKTPLGLLIFLVMRF